MNEQKQIEKMAQDVCGYCNNYGVCILDDKKCDFKCSHRDVAEQFYNAGYRKQSEGEWIFEHEYYGKMICSNCKGEALVNECSEYVDSDFCPNCGAKMKGGEKQ